MCVMAYGQTGSGKTHTMLGSYDNASAKLGNIEDGGGGGGEGVVPRAIREIFRCVQSHFYSDTNVMHWMPYCTFVQGIFF